MSVARITTERMVAIAIAAAWLDPVDSSMLFMSASQIAAVGGKGKVLIYM